MFDSIVNLLLVLLAFGFVIFWHELGHFLAARWAGVRVEQFAVGMGQAVVSWRKGIGFRVARFSGGKFKWGSTQDDFEKRVLSEWAKRQGELPAHQQRKEPSLREQYDIAKSLGIGETEYRLSWVPLGGYVKPTGQDDLRPAAEVGADDPHAFGAKSVGKRMVIISAGVIMNVILAFMLYVLLFRVVGFNSPPAVVGMVVPASPAQASGLQVADKIRAINGDPVAGFTHVTMNVALLRDDEDALVEVERPGVEKPIELRMRPVKTVQSYNMPSLGIGGPMTLKGAPRDPELTAIAPELDMLPEGATIVAINGEAVGVNDVHKLDAALQAYNGTPIEFKIQLADGTSKSIRYTPELSLTGFADTTLSIAGMRPRVMISAVLPDTPAQKAGLQGGDVIQQLAIADTAETLSPPSSSKLRDWINRAGTAGRDMRLTVVRDGKTIAPISISATASPEKGKKGIGVALDYESAAPVIGEVVDNSPARGVGLRAGDRITVIDGKPIKDWHDVLRALREKPSGDIRMTVATDTGTRDVTMQLGTYADQLSQIRYTHNFPLDSRLELRETDSSWVAMKWGVEETKYSIFQVYQTLQRLFQGTVPVSNLSGPLGIFTAGASAADRGTDWLIWFTALISANLAVVNFLPIPIVDGGLFLFLLAEKITGKPPSPRVQAVAQVIGLVLLGGLFLFVTYHDILRTIG